MNHVFCIAHRQPLYRIPDHWIMVWLGDAPIEDENLRERAIIVRDIYPDLDFYRPMLGGSAGPLAVLRFMRESYPAEGELANHQVTLVQYRKFLTQDQVGREAQNYPRMQLVKPEEAGSIDVDAAIKRWESLFRLAYPINVSGLVSQYAQSHHVQDLLRYTAYAVDLNVLAKHEIDAFFQIRTLFPGGVEFGSFPADFWCELTTQLEAVAMSWMRLEHPTSVDSYQRRAVSFCNERLGSFMLAKAISEIYQGSPDPLIFGHMVTVTSADLYYGGA